MATITEKLKWLIEADATSAVKGFEKTGAAAEKELGKATKSSQKLGGQLTKGGAAAVGFAAVAGGALIKTAGAFEDLALQAGKMSDATGLSVEDSSRWIEVAGDMGIEAGTVEGAIGKMNKTLGTSPEKFAALGIEVATTKDGLTDVNGTFLNSIARLNEISDPAERAATAAGVFGKSWMDSAELLKLSTDDIKNQMASVSDSKVINQGELDKAKEYRASLDSLSDSVEELGLSVGQSAAPVIGGFAKTLSAGVGAFTHVNEATHGAIGTFATFGVAAIGAAGAISVVAGQAIKMKDRFTAAEGGLNTMGKAAGAASVGLAVLGVTLAGLQILNAVTEDSEDASAAINHFVNEAGHMDDAAEHPLEFLKSWRTMSERVDQDKGLFDRTMGDIGHAFDQSGENLAHLQQGFDKLLKTSPDLARQTVEALEATAAAAAAGDQASQDWLDSNSLTENQIAGMRTKVDDLAGAQAVLTGGTQQATDVTNKYGVVLGDSASALLDATGVAGGYLAAMHNTAQETEAATEAERIRGVLLDDAITLSGQYKQAQEDATQAIKDEAAALQAQADALDASSDAFRAAADANYAVLDATDAYNTLLAGQAQAVKDAGGDQEAIAKIYRDGTEAAATVADATNRLADEQAAAAGVTRTATEKLDQWNLSMLDSATKAGPAQRAEILRYIGQVNNIPDEKMTEVQALIDAGKLDEAQILLAELSETRDAKVEVDADTAQANAKIEAERLKQEAKPITFKGNVSNWELHNQPTTIDLQGRVFGGGKRLFASGGIVRATPGGESVTVGEGGRDEAIIPLNNDGSIAGVSGGAGGGVTIQSLTINMPVGSDGNDVIRKIQQFERRNGPGWRS